ncbi:hypothetical protein MKEN_00433300 [Mycena kentingensis (nom. inval.)]|nr:hypothetical protein MKEN_00433300 [Mycena kentingensis (nom. inval.)]
MDSVDDWIEFLRNYSRGADCLPPALPAAVDGRPTHTALPLPSFEIPLYPPGDISPETARIIATFYSQYNFLPPPRAEEEVKRRAVIAEYNLFRSDQTENFNRCSALVNSIFNFAPICTISLFQHDTQIVVSKAGEFPVKPGEGLVTETSICGHVVLKKVALELAQINDDWRFLGNPWCSRSGGLQGYIGVPIILDADPSSPHSSERVTVGVLALMSSDPFPTLSASQRDILHNITAMLSAQLRSTWEGWRGGRETRMRDAVSMFLERALVEPYQLAVTKAQVAADPPVQGSSPRSAFAGAHNRTLSNESLFSSAAEQIRELLEADFVALVDLTECPSWNRLDGKPPRLFGSCHSQRCEGMESNFAFPISMANIVSFLDLFATTGRSIFPAPWGRSGLEPLLMLSAGVKRKRGTSNSSVPHVAVPFYSDDQPKLLIIVSSSAPLFTFNQSDVTECTQDCVFVANEICFFLDQIVLVLKVLLMFTHELRTPLHGLLGQLDLLRDRLSNGDLSMVPTLLDSADFCGAALRDIVDDVLDFGKMSRDPKAIATSPPLPLTQVDLLQITSEALKTSWVRRLQFQAATATSDEEQKLELVLEYEDRSALAGWWLSVDVSGYRRILNNLLINSLKYTAAGTITVSLVSGLGVASCPQIVLRCTDTGQGIAPDFLGKIFDPFTQADSFSPGAGLGLHITKSIVARMGGTITVESRLGFGSTFTVALPIKGLALRELNTDAVLRSVVVTANLDLKIAASNANEESPGKPTPQPETTIATKPSTSSENEPPLKILVVDDNAISRKILVTMLSKRANATTYQAEDGLAAVKVFREVKPDAVWTDVSMPNMDGVVKMRAIERAQGWPPAHIVAITGLGMSDERIRNEALMSSAALDGWLIKGQARFLFMRPLESYGPAEIAHGPFFIGLGLNLLLYGATFVQVYIYFLTYRRDKAWTKIFVVFVLFLDTLNTAFDFAYLYKCLIIHYGDVKMLGSADWLFATDPAMTGIIAASVQLFYAWRIKVLTGNMWLTGTVAILALIGLASAIGTTVEVHLMPHFVDFIKFKSVVIIWLLAACIADIVITGILVFHLKSHKSGIEGSDVLVDRIIRMTLQTGLATSLCASIDLILYLSDPIALHLIFNIPLCKLYTNSLLSSLNARTVRKDSSHGSGGDGLMANKPRPPQRQSIALNLDEPLEMARAIPAPPATRIGKMA